MDNRRNIGRLAILAFGVFASAGHACKPTINYLRPSNYELVKTTERIVLARAVRFEPGCRTAFALLQPIKGELPASELVLEGCRIGAEDGDAHDADADFSGARSSGGSCTPVSYEQGQKYLLFLALEDRRWQVSGPAFSRVNEPVNGKEAPWFRAVERYAAIASLGDEAAEKQALRALQASATSTDDTAMRMLSEDIADHFTTVSDHKSYLDLRDLHDRATDEEQRNRVLWAWANRGDPEAKPLFDALLASGRSDSPVAAYFEKIGDRASLARFADAFLAAGNTQNDWWARVAPLSAMLGLAGSDDIDLVLKVYEKATESHEARMVAEWMALHPDARLRNALRSRIAGNYVEHSAATFALAASGDEDVARWAIASVEQADADQWVSLYALARSPLASSDAAIGVLIGRPDERLVPVVQGYGGALHARAAERLSELVALPEKSKELDYWLWRTLSEMKEAGRLERADELLAALPDDAQDFEDE